MRILLDTNIVLDLFLDREPFSEDAAKIFSKIESGEIKGYLCTTTVNTISYFLQKSLSPQVFQNTLKDILSMFEIAEVNKRILMTAQSSVFNDYEDAVIHESARKIKAEAIITRNKKDFANSKIAIYNSKEFLSIIN